MTLLLSTLKYILVAVRYKTVRYKRENIIILQSLKCKRHYVNGKFYMMNLHIFYEILYLVFQENCINKLGVKQKKISKQL